MFIEHMVTDMKRLIDRSSVTTSDDTLPTMAHYHLLAIICVYGLVIVNMVTAKNFFFYDNALPENWNI